MVFCDLRLVEVLWLVIMASEIKASGAAKSVFCDNIGGALAQYPHAKRVGRYIYLSGLSARQKDNSVRGVEELPTGQINRCISEQTRGVIENMKKVLAEVGGSLEDLIDVTVFLTDMANYAEFNKVYNAYFDAKNGPSRTTVGVASLPGKDLLIEIKGTAYLSQD